MVTKKDVEKAKADYDAVVERHSLNAAAYEAEKAKLKADYVEADAAAAARYAAADAVAWDVSTAAWNKYIHLELEFEKGNITT